MSKEKRHNYTSDVQLLIDYTRGTRLISDADLDDACSRLEYAIREDLSDYSVPCHPIFPVKEFDVPDSSITREQARDAIRAVAAAKKVLAKEKK